MLRQSNPEIAQQATQSYIQQQGGAPTVENRDRLNRRLGNMAMMQTEQKRPELQRVETADGVFMVDPYTGQKVERIGEPKSGSTNANDVLMQMLGGSGQNRRSRVPALKSTNAPAAEGPTKIDNKQNKPATEVDILTKKYETEFTDKEGNTWATNPITGRRYLVEAAKKQQVKMNDIEDINSAIESYNNIVYAKDNWDPSYTGMVDDKVRWLQNKTGYQADDSDAYNKWAAKLQTVANAARNKSFGAALSGFDIEEFAKEFPATDAGDPEVVPKLEAKQETLKKALQNTYNAWADKYGKERADKFFSGLQDKSVIGQDTQDPDDNISDDEILKALGQ
jgi:predicted metal-dependent hydrolase